MKQLTIFDIDYNLANKCYETNMKKQNSDVIKEEVVNIVAKTTCKDNR